MSRYKFEEWFGKKFPIAFDRSGTQEGDRIIEIEFQSYQAGRESMRYEAADVCYAVSEGYNDITTAEICEQKIRNIDL